MHLATLLVKPPLCAKPFIPQLQRTVVKAGVRIFLCRLCPSPVSRLGTLSVISVFMYWRESRAMYVVRGSSPCHPIRGKQL